MNRPANMAKRVLPVILLLGFAAAVIAQGEDPYETYLKTSRDFKPVRMDPAVSTKAYPSWVFMPWYFQWTLGYDDAAGEFCKTTGINGAFANYGHGHLNWYNTYQLRFYMDHTAGKGDLHQWDKFPKDKADRIHGTGLRCRPLNATMKEKLEAHIRKSIEAVKSSPMRAAYALDDEISWGHFVHPCMWQVIDDAGAYPAWLKEIYGAQAPHRTGWTSYNDIRDKLTSWTVATFDASPLMDQWTFNDSCWNNFLGDLVTYANQVDPATPCGFVGGQCPNTFGGYDYAKIMRKIQFLEAYNMANVQSIIRSFNPHNVIPTVTTYFYVSLADAEWQVWYYLAQGNRGHIAWVENWFNGKKPKEWLRKIAPTYHEAGEKIGPLMTGAEFKSDGVALYYSHASIQLGWILDAAAHGDTWINRNSDHKLGSAHLVRNAWCNMLRDEGLQFTWLSYVDLIQNGVPPGTKVLILPATLCLSDAEALRIKAFCKAGGTVIADYMPGLWDQHGKGRTQGGALDDLFGVHHDPALSARDVFQGNGQLWCEVNQDEHFEYKSYASLFSNNSCIHDSSGFNKAVRTLNVPPASNLFGKGSATLLNLSPQWYLAHRAAGLADAAKRAVFMKPIHDAGVKRWVQLKTTDSRTFGYEITYWTKDNRTLLFLIANQEVTTTSAGGGAASGLITNTVPVTLQFTHPVAHVKDERTGKILGSGLEFPLLWKMNEACVVSFDSVP